MKIGLALGSGSSRGWAHIGVIKALENRGIRPDIICGSSIGALVGASYIAGNLDKLHEWTCSLSRMQLAKYFELNASFNGFVDIDRFQEFLNEYVVDEEALIENQPKQYAAVATDLTNGREIWLTDGPVHDAVWASISLPGLFPPISNKDKWLVDGGLVNPVPVSVCRALGADIVIAVNLNGDIVGKHLRKLHKPAQSTEPDMLSKISEFVKKYSDWDTGSGSHNAPNLIDAIASSINIAQDRITRSRLAGDPPDILLSLRLSHIGLLEFYRAGEVIAEGEKAVHRISSEITDIIATM